MGGEKRGRKIHRLHGLHRFQRERRVRPESGNALASPSHLCHRCNLSIPSSSSPLLSHLRNLRIVLPSPSVRRTVHASTDSAVGPRAAAGVAGGVAGGGGGGRGARPQWRGARAGGLGAWRGGGPL